MPPRWTWPSTVARVSLPVRRSISPSSQWPTPPSRTWPKASVFASSSSGMPPIGRAPSATTMIGAKWLAKRRPTSSADRVDVELALRDQDRVGAAGEARVDGDPARVAAHHLDDQHPVVAVGGGVEAVDRLHRDVDRGVEAEGVVGGGEVVVDRLRHADHVQAVLGVEARGGAEGVLAADRDQPVDPGRRQVGGDPLGPVVDGERVGPRGAEDGAAAGQDAAHLGHPERPPVVLERPAPAVPVADELVPLHAHPLRTTARITAFSPGQSPPPVKHADPHRASLEIDDRRSGLRRRDRRPAADLVRRRLLDGRLDDHRGRRKPRRGARDPARRTRPRRRLRQRQRGDRRGAALLGRRGRRRLRPGAAGAGTRTGGGGAARRSSSSRPTPRTSPSRTRASTSRCRSSARCSRPTRSAPRRSCSGW